MKGRGHFPLGGGEGGSLRALQKGEYFLPSPEYPLFSLTAGETQVASILAYCRAKCCQDLCRGTLRRALLIFKSSRYFPWKCSPYYYAHSEVQIFAELSRKKSKILQN